MNPSIPTIPVANDTPTTKPIIKTGMHSATTSTKSAAIRPSSSDEPLDRGEQQAFEVAARYVGDQCVRRDTPVTAKITATGSWNAV